VADAPISLIGRKAAMITKRVPWAERKAPGMFVLIASSAYSTLSTIVPCPSRVKLKIGFPGRK
jgi:hypothetical protein